MHAEAGRRQFISPFRSAPVPGRSHIRRGRQRWLVTQTVGFQSCLLRLILWTQPRPDCLPPPPRHPPPSTARHPRRLANGRARHSVRAVVRWPTTEPFAPVTACGELPAPPGCRPTSQPQASFPSLATTSPGLKPCNLMVLCREVCPRISSTRPRGQSKRSASSSTNA